jgi:hypothetical protein
LTIVVTNAVAVRNRPNVAYRFLVLSAYLEYGVGTRGVVTVVAVGMPRRLVAIENETIVRMRMFLRPARIVVTIFPVRMQSISITAINMRVFRLQARTVRVAVDMFGITAVRHYDAAA